MRSNKKRTRGKNIKYNNKHTYSKREFEFLRQLFESKKEWQKKREYGGKTFYNHNSCRKGQICKFSTAANKICNGKLQMANSDCKVKFTIWANDDGFKHFKTEMGSDLAAFMENRNVAEKNSNAASGCVEMINIGFCPREEALRQLNKLSHELERMGIGAWSPCRQIENEDATEFNPSPAEIISVSADHDRISWVKLRANPYLKMVIARSSVGLKLDREFARNFEAMVNIGFVQLGVYHHFLDGRNLPTPEQQAEFLNNELGKVGFNKKRHLIAVAGNSDVDAGNRRAFTARLAMFVKGLLQSGFLLPIIYTNNNAWRKLIEPNVADELFRVLPLWIANFTEHPNGPKYPDTWKQWWLWQYSDEGKIDGIKNHAHLSRRNPFYAVKDQELFS